MSLRNHSYALLVLALVPFSSLHAAEGDAECSHYFDYSSRFPWVPAPGGPITPEERAGFDRLRAMSRYNPAMISPAADGLTDAAMDDLERRVASVLRLETDPATGAVRGRPMVFTGEGGAPQADPAKPANFAGDFYPLLSEAVRAYRSSRGSPAKPVSEATRERARALLGRLAVHLANQPWDGAVSKHPDVWIGNGYGWRDKDGGMGYRLLSLTALIGDPALRAKYLENLFWIQGGVGMREYSTLSTDDYINVCSQTLAAVSLMGDCPAKRQRLAMMRHALETSMLRPGAHGTVTADGGVIHHGFAHSAYAAYEFGPLCRLLRDVASAGAPSTRDTPEVISRLYAVAKANVWITQPGAYVTSLEGRPVIPMASETARVTRRGGAGMIPDVLVTAAALGAPEDDPRRTELVALFRVKQPGDARPGSIDEALWDKAAGVPSPLSGHFTYPVSCASVHRRDDWMAVVRGSAKNRTGGEGQPYTNPGSRQSMGGHYCHGSLLILADGVSAGAPPDLISSGHAADGYDMALMPGVTSLHSGWASLVGRYFGSDARFCASASLDGQGVWGYRPSWAAKSCFFFGNRITYVTSGAVMKKSGEIPMVTCAAQLRHRDADTRLDTLDGALFATGERRFADGKAHTLLTPTGHGYYFFPTTEPLVVRCGEQESRFMEPALLRPEFAKGNTWAELMAKNVNDATRARNLDKFKALKGRVTTAYWDHGPGARQGAPVAFTVVVRSGAAGLERFARAMAEPAMRPVRLSVSDKAHVVYDSVSRLWGAVFFDGGSLGEEHAENRAFPLRAVNRPCSVVLKSGPEGLRLSVAAGENAFFENGYATAGLFELTFAGRWRVVSPADARAQVGEDGLTRVSCTLRRVQGDLLVLAPAAP